MGLSESAQTFLIGLEGENADCSRGTRRILVTLGDVFGLSQSFKSRLAIPATSPCFWPTGSLLRPSYQVVRHAE
jgi:hypothetical protein